MHFHDPIHGAMDTSAMAEKGALTPLVQTRHLQRLRGVRQLGFASVAYPLADHSRFSHALGSAYVAGELAERCHLNNHEAKSLGETFPGLKNASTIRAGIRSHVALAALMQDMGELPFERALINHYRVDQATRISLKGWTASFDSLDSKTAFNLAILSQWSSSGRLGYYDAHLLAALLDHSIATPKNSQAPLAKVRLILSSELDADRIDYVYRDSTTTIGHPGSPRELLSTIEAYEPGLVRVTDPAIVASFLNSRIHLYRSVYMAPDKRVREMALSTVLRDVSTKPALAPIWGDTPLPGEVSLENFLALDDASIMRSLAQMRDNAASRRSLSRGGALALETLVGEGSASYDSTWVPPTSPPPVPGEVPESILADARDDYARGAISDLDFFKVSSSRFLGPEESASLRGWIPELDSGTLAPGSLLAFIPKGLDADERRKLDHAVASGSLYGTLKERAMLSELGSPSDTRRMRGFKGPSIHISWCWADLNTVRRVVRALFDLKARYWLLLDPFEGVGSSPSNNSKTLVTSADCLLILTSKEYTRRYRDNVNGNIAAELQQVHSRLQVGPPLSTVVLALDDWRDAESNFPWGLIGRDAADFTGAVPLSSATDAELLEAMRSSINVLGGTA